MHCDFPREIIALNSFCQGDVSVLQLDQLLSPRGTEHAEHASTIGMILEYNKHLRNTKGIPLLM